MYGPAKSGKSHIAQQISKLHKRAVIRFDEIINWNLENNPDLASKIKSFLADRRKEFEQATL